MRRYSCFVIVFVLIVAPGYALSQQDFSGVEIKTTLVAGKVYMLEGRGGNIGVSVGSDGILIVDDQFAPLAATITLGEPPPAATITTDYAAAVAALQREVPRVLAEKHVPGAAVALIDDQRAVFLSGFGFTDTSNTQPITGDTLFSLQSVSKTYTATAFLILRSEERRVGKECRL